MSMRAIVSFYHFLSVNRIIGNLYISLLRKRASNDVLISELKQYGSLFP